MTMVVIGSLAAAALPRFFNSVSQAQIATNRSMAGHLRAGINIARASWIANGAIYQTGGIDGTN